MFPWRFLFIANNSAPAYGGIVYSICNILGTVPDIVSPYIVDARTEEVCFCILKYIEDIFLFGLIRIRVNGKVYFSFNVWKIEN